VALVIATCVEFLRFLISRQPLQLNAPGARQYAWSACVCRL